MDPSHPSPSSSPPRPEFLPKRSSDSPALPDGGRASDLSIPHVANQLTLLRLIFIPFVIINVLDQNYGWALLLFVAAGLSDALDGVLARGSSNKPCSANTSIRSPTNSC